MRRGAVSRRLGGDRRGAQKPMKSPILLEFRLANEERNRDEREMDHR